MASGGIHVLNIPELYAIYGNDAFWLFGGGTHGHPKGSRAGRRANRVASRGGRRRQDARGRGQDLSGAARGDGIAGDVKFQVSE